MVWWRQLITAVYYGNWRGWMDLHDSLIPITCRMRRLWTGVVKKPHVAQNKAVTPATTPTTKAMTSVIKADDNGNDNSHDDRNFDVGEDDSDRDGDHHCAKEPLHSELGDSQDVAQNVSC